MLRQRTAQLDRRRHPPADDVQRRRADCHEKGAGRANRRATRTGFTGVCTAQPAIRGRRTDGIARRNRREQDGTFATPWRGARGPTRASGPGRMARRQPAFAGNRCQTRRNRSQARALLARCLCRRCAQTGHMASGYLPTSFKAHVGTLQDPVFAAAGQHRPRRQPLERPMASRSAIRPGNGTYAVAPTQPA